MLESAEQTLNFWREQYDRYQQKKQLTLKRRFLERELAWAEISTKEEAISDLKKRLSDRRDILGKIEGKIKLSEQEVQQLLDESRDAKNMWLGLFEERLSFEREKARHEFNVLNSEETKKELREWAEHSQEDMKQIVDAISSLESALGVLNPHPSPVQVSEIRDTLKELSRWPETLFYKIEKLEELAKSSNERIYILDAQLSDIKERTKNLDFRLEDLNNRVLEEKIDLAILKYQSDEISKELVETEKSLKILEADLNEATKRAEEMGPRIVALRIVDEVLDEIRVVDGRIAALADVSGEIERMYESYSKLYLELKEKARVTAENREKALEEIKTRMEAWRTMIRGLLDHVSLEYQKILTQAVATGLVRLMNDHDIEATGIEILVGFKGSQPLPLSIYSQSGGERSTATMAFLLALQQRVQSPFRAIDEYDVHMDPKNREMIANVLISAVEGGDAQYLAITPNQMFFEGKDAHIITVQNIEGTSLVREVG